MKYLVDEALCCGHGRCAMLAPEVYEISDAGLNAAVGRFVEVPDEHEPGARAGALACPEAAIRIFD